MKILFLFPIIAMLLIATACERPSKAAIASKPLEVLVADVQQKDVPLYREWIGTLDGFVNAEIKAQVSGYLVKQEYTEGSFVGRANYSSRSIPGRSRQTWIRPKDALRSHKASWSRLARNSSQAEAQVAVAEANQHRVQLDVDRYTPLAQQHAITEQDLDNATQNNMAAKAQLQAARAQVETDKAQITAAMAAVQSAKAAVETAQINLGFTRLTAPIDGIPGIAQQQVGALVSPASGAVTTVSTLDPIKVYFTISEQEYLERKRQYPTAEKFLDARQRLELELVLADGTAYPHKGKSTLQTVKSTSRLAPSGWLGCFRIPATSCVQANTAKSEPQFEFRSERSSFLSKRFSTSKARVSSRLSMPATR